MKKNCIVSPYTHAAITMEQLAAFCTPTQLNIIAFLFQESNNHEGQYDVILLRIMEWIGSVSSIQGLFGKTMQTKGHVQSGKSNFIRVFSLVCAAFRIQSLVIVRNLMDDAEQLMRGYTDLLSRLIVAVPDAAYIKVGDNELIQIVLSNPSALKRHVGNTAYALIVDENDTVDSTDRAEKTRRLSLLKQTAFCYMGVTATALDPLLKDNITPSHMFVLPTPTGYKGIRDILTQTRILTQNAVFSGGVKDDLVANNPEWCFLVDEMMTRPVLESNSTVYPHIWLSNMGRTIQPYLTLQETLRLSHTALTTLVYNGKGVTISAHGQVPVVHKQTIAWCLQWLKTNGGVASYPHIMIFSGELAGRGISFTDMDHEWHLTGMYLVASDKTDEVELIQKIRLCGVYKDNLPLELHTTQSIKTDIEKSYLRQEELMTRMLAQTDGFRDTLATLTLHKEKFTKRHVTKNEKCRIKRTKTVSLEEWDVSVYQGTELPPRDYYELQGLEPPTDSERLQWRDTHHAAEIVDATNSTNGEWFISETDMGTDLERRTYRHIIDFFELNYQTTVFRAKITAYIQEQEQCKDDVARSRIEKVFDHKKDIVEEGLCIKKHGHRWTVRHVKL